MNTTGGGIHHSESARGFALNPSGARILARSIAFSALIVIGLSSSASSKSEDAQRDQYIKEYLMPEAFDPRYKLLTSSQIDVNIWYPQHISSASRDTLETVVEHTLAHYPRHMRQKYLVALILTDDRTKIVPTNVEGGKIENKTAEDLAGYSYSPWRIVHIYIPTDDQNPYTLEGTGNHEMGHLITNDVTLPSHAYALARWNTLFDMSKKPEDFSYSRIIKNGTSNAQISPSEDMAVTAEALFNSYGTRGWSEIRHNQKISPIFAEKVRLILRLEYEASLGCMDSGYWKMIENRGPHAGKGDDYRQYFRHKIDASGKLCE